MTGLTFVLILICLIVFVLGIVGLFKPLANLKMKDRWAAACWVAAGIVGFGAVAINSPAPPPVAPQPAPKTGAAAVVIPPDPAWLQAVNYCGGTSRVHPSNVACGQVLEFEDAPPACREFATLFARGRQETVAGGSAAALCDIQVTAITDPEYAQSPLSAELLALLRINAAIVRSCVAGDKAACRAVEATETDGYCGLYAGLIASQGRGVQRDEELEGSYRERCRRELALI